ncbi:MAG: hypothetical protein DMD61_08795 [Gemmatimonadetes bacterium]|nr:MAG: hypothetical protein DMD61_08795 [Gemmatimonadota bacterium]
MKRRKPQRKPRRTRRRQAPLPATQPVGDADPLADARIRPLLERYCGLAGVKQAARGPDHSELSLPPPERPFFRDRAALRVAFSLDALERDPDAEIAVLGSPFLSQLIEAIRARASRLSLGLIAPPGVARDPEDVELTIPVRDGTAKRGETRRAVHPVGRLVARVVLRAGAGVEEAVVESDVFDLSAGARVGDDLAGAFRDLEAGRVDPAKPSVAGDAAPIPAREPADVVRLLLGHLQEKSAERVAARRAVAEKDLALELARLDRYFETILKEQTDPESLGTVTALAERRRAEEIRRSEVKAVVHPLQLIEASALIERVEWRLESTRGRRATFSAQCSLSDAADWIMACPQCGAPPATLVVCRHEGGHCSCDACSHRCSVCAEDFCAEHGIGQCRVDGQPACDEHVRVCPSCRLQHCTAHAGVCAEDGHAACTACLAPCGSCGRVICNRHAEQSHAEAPKGSRRLCAACLRYCEGGTSEPVGVDEVVQCATCSKSVCTVHRAECVVDGEAHCSRHLHRTDESRRLVCGRHRAGCALEPAAIFASDEVGACASCGKLVCADHAALCIEDGLRHCVTHLEPLHDATGSYACAAHRKQCHMDGHAFSLKGAKDCPVCGKGACTEHRVPCAYCGRHVCTADLSRESRRCATCTRLEAIATPELPAEVVTAARSVTRGAPKPSRAWRMARDRSHLVVEVDLGLRRRAVFTVRHGESVPDSVVKHSLLGSKQRR